MSLISLPRLSSIGAAIFLSATLLQAALPAPAEAPERASLTGQLLIAAPTMGDPRFAHCAPFGDRERPVLELQRPLIAVSITLAASYKSVRTRRSPHFEMLPV